MDALFEFLFGGIFDRPLGWLFFGGIRRQVKELQAQHDHAKQAGEPLACDLPADLRTHQPDPRGRERGKWSRGILHVRATSLLWEPQPGKQGQSWDLTTATVTRQRTYAASSSKYLAWERLIMQTGGQAIELAIRQPFLPFLRAGLEQAVTGSRDGTAETGPEPGHR